MNYDRTESSISRDRDSDDDWEAKEASRTHSVKFTEDMPEIKEVSLCCCFGKRAHKHASTNVKYKYLWYNIHVCFHNAGVSMRSTGRYIVGWFRNVRRRFAGHRAYLALSTILVAIE